MTRATPERTRSRDLDLSALVRRPGVRLTVDAWIDNFLRRHATLASPASSMGGQGERLVRLSSDSEGRRIMAPSGNEIPCKDDSAAHNSAHRADARLADHGADLIIWSALEVDEQRVLILQRTPVICDGGGKVPVTVPAEFERPEFVGCSGCGRPATDETLDHFGQVRAHVFCVAIEQERLISEWRPGDGSECIDVVRTTEARMERRRVWEPVHLHLEDIAAQMNLSERQVRSRISSARATIAERLFEGSFEA
jgi:predicted DNA-binding protein (UPF0251 family)